MTLTEHGKELLRVEVLHAPLGLEMMRLGIHVVVERRLSTKRVDNSQQATAHAYAICSDTYGRYYPLKFQCHLTAEISL